MIEYINKRLNDWAQWKLSDRQTLRHMLGTKSCWPRMLGESESTETVRQIGALVPLNDLECCETDKAVCALPEKLKETVIEFYARAQSVVEISKRLGIDKTTLYRRLDSAHQHILGTLNDIAAGIIV